MIALPAVKKLVRKPLFITIVLVLLLLAAILLFFSLRKDPGMTSLLQEGNRLVAAGEFEDASRLLEAVLQKKTDKKSITEFLRLHARMAAQDGNWQRLLTAASETTELYKKNKTFWAYRVVSESRCGLHEAAIRHADTYLTNKEYAGLRLEAALAAGKEVLPSEVPEYYVELFQLTETRDPEEYLRMAGVFQNDAMALQGLLLTAEKIGTREAYELADQPLEEQYPFVVAYLSYDRGEYQRALHSLKKAGPLQQEDYLTLLGDIYLAQGYTSSAFQVYQRIKEQECGITPEILHNLSRLMENKYDALRMLEDGFRCFPDHRLLSLSRITLMLELQMEEALSLLKEHLQQYPDDGYAKLLWESYSGHARIGDVYSARFYLQQYSDDRLGEQAASYALSFLGTTGRTDEMGEFLQREKTAYGNTAWYLLYQGLHLALRGEYPKAIDLLEQSWEMEARPETLYNMAVIHRALKDYYGAGNLLIQALIQARQKYTLDKHSTARFEQELAEVFFLQGYRTEALQAARRALMEDPGNLRARQLEKMIINEGKK